MALAPPDRSYMAQAKCADADPSLFFPGDLDPGDPFDTDVDDLVEALEDVMAQELATQYCGNCPVHIACLEDGLSKGRANLGIWGGLGSSKRVHLNQIRARIEADAEDAGQQPDLHAYVPGCSCDFCATATAYLNGEQLDRNTPGARHGYLSTYDRGCKCCACGFAGLRNSRRRNIINANTGQS